MTTPNGTDTLIERLRAASSRPARDTLGLGDYWNLCDEAADALALAAPTDRKAALEALDLWKVVLDSIGDAKTFQQDLDRRKQAEVGAYYTLQQHFATIRAALAAPTSLRCVRCDMNVQSVRHGGPDAGVCFGCIPLTAPTDAEPLNNYICNEGIAYEHEPMVRKAWNAALAAAPRPAARAAPGDARPVARRWKKRINCGQGQFIESDWSYTDYYPDDELEKHPNVLACEPLYAAPPAAAPTDAEREAIASDLESYAAIGSAGLTADEMLHIASLLRAALPAAVPQDTKRLDWMQANVSAIRDIGWIEGDLRTAIDRAIAPSPTGGEE